MAVTSRRAQPNLNARCPGPTPNTATADQAIRLLFKCAKNVTPAQNKVRLRWMKHHQEYLSHGLPAPSRTLRTLHPPSLRLSFAWSRVLIPSGRIHTRRSSSEATVLRPVTHLQFMDCGALSTTRRRFHALESAAFDHASELRQSPSATCKSEWHTPQASTLIKTSGLQLWLRDFFEFQGLLEFIQDRAFISIPSARVWIHGTAKRTKVSWTRCMRRIHFIDSCEPLTKYIQNSVQVLDYSLFRRQAAPAQEKCDGAADRRIVYEGL